jgi:hypothetical protein
MSVEIGHRARSPFWERNLMNAHANPRRRLHLVTAAATSKPEAPKSDDKPDEQMALHIAEGVLKFQTLQDEFDDQAFSPHPDMERVGQLILEMKTVRERLAAHGVKV